VRHTWSITDSCPTPAAFEETLGITYLRVGANAFALVEAADRGWIEDIGSNVVPANPDPLWDIEVSVDDPFEELRGDAEVVSIDSMRVSVTILKGSEVVFSLRDAKSANFKSNPELLGEMLNILNGISEV
jgi:hypothetical protein